MLTGVSRCALPSEGEVEKGLAGEPATRCTDCMAAQHLERVQEGAGPVRAALDAGPVRCFSTAIFPTRIGGVTMCPGCAARLWQAGFVPAAVNENIPRRGGDGGCCVVLVAGTGFEPVTFRL